MYALRKPKENANSATHEQWNVGEMLSLPQLSASCFMAQPRVYHRSSSGVDDDLDDEDDDALRCNCGWFSKSWKTQLYYVTFSEVRPWPWTWPEATECRPWP